MRTTVTYLAGGYLNAGASATAGGSTEPVTGLPIATGVNVGQALFWLNSAANKTYIVTGNATGNSPDLAGFVIDPTMTTILPYAWMQVNGKINALFDATPATAFGDTVGLTDLTHNTVTRQGTGTQALTGVSVGVALAVGVASTKALVRIDRPQSRF